jgi:glycosyltransferase involved in cell wall biosynthesis
MRILLITQFYPPEVGAPQNRLSYLVRRLARSGHSVTVLTAFPNYPTGEIFADYRGRLWSDEQENGIRVVRTWLYATISKALVPRLLSYCSFSLLALVAGLVKISRQDAVIVESPPLPLGVSGVIISWAKRSRLVLNVSDLWPESAVALGILKNPRLIRFATLLEMFLYKKADLITGQTDGIVENIRSRCPEKDVALVPNGVDLEFFAPSTLKTAAEPSARERFGANGAFIVGYAGLMGLAQDLDTVLDAAKLLRGIPEILFVLVGGGPEADRLKKKCEGNGSRNVRLISAQSASQMPDMLRAFDVALVPLKRHRLFKGARPSKMFEAMGMALPIICSVDGEARRIVEESQGGIYVEPENSQQMAEAVLQLYKNPERRILLGANARRYVATHFDKAAIADDFERLLATVQ